VATLIMCHTGGNNYCGFTVYKLFPLPTKALLSSLLGLVIQHGDIELEYYFQLLDGKTISYN